MKKTIIEYKCRKCKSKLVNPNDVCKKCWLDNYKTPRIGE